MTDTFWIICFPTFIHKNFTPITDKAIVDKVTDIDTNPLFLQVALLDKEKAAKSDIALRFSRVKEFVNTPVVAEIQLQYQDHCCLLCKRNMKKP